MLKSEVTKQADALERYLCQALDKCQRHPMNDDESEIMIRLLFAPDEEFGSQEDVMKIWQYQALIKRAEHCLTATFDKRVLFFIMMLPEGAIGTSIMYLYYIQYLAKKKNIKHVSFNVFCEHLFPMGFISNDDLHKVWDACKVSAKEAGGTDNLIDYSEAAKSIQFGFENHDFGYRGKTSESEKEKESHLKYFRGTDTTKGNDRISISSPPKRSGWVNVFYKSDPSRIHKLFYDSSRKKFVTKCGRNKTHRLLNYRFIDSPF